MKRRAAALLALSLVGTAGAADYSKALWSYVTAQGVPKPLMDSRLMGELVMRMWARPQGLPVESVITMYMPTLSPKHWTVMVSNPSVTAGELVGARQLKFLGVVPSTKSPSEKMNLFQLGDGLFKGLYVMEGRTRDKTGKTIHIVALLTPQMMDEKLLPGDALK